jgi:hypothetical protein
MSLNNHIHSVYTGNIKNSKPVNLHRLGHTLKDIKQPDEATMMQIELIRNEKDEEKRARLKWKLKTYTPAIVCHEYRRYENIVNFSGLLPLDFDKLPSMEYAIEFKEMLFKTYPYIYAVWLSASALGVRAFVHIPIVETPEQYKAHYRAIKKIMGVYTGFDMAPQNAVLPLFQSHDPNLLYRTEAEMFTKTYYEPITPPRPIVPIQCEDKQTQHVVNIVTSAISKINDNGHPQLRAISYALGGYIGAGYISYFDAHNLIYDLIETNSYLKLKQNVYKQTAKTMLNQGQSQPLYL